MNSESVVEHWEPLIEEFSRGLLVEYERLHDRIENSGNRMRLSPAQQRIVELGHITVFLRDLLKKGNFRQHLMNGHQFVLATYPDSTTKKDVVVGITNFKLVGSELQGQFTCVNPSFQGQGIGKKLHRAIHGYATRIRKKYYVGNLSPIMHRIYEKWKLAPPGNPRDIIKTKVPKNPRDGGPSATFTPFSKSLRRRKRH